MRVVILSDTHIPTLARTLPGWVRAEIRSADHVIHAGDFDSIDAYTRLISLTGGNVTAVKGNKDPAELDLPTVTTVEIAGNSFVVIHRSESDDDRLREIGNVVLQQGGSDAIGVTGHTHSPEDTVVNGVRILNPGSATGIQSAESVSIISVSITDGEIDVECIEKPRTLAHRTMGYWSRLVTSLRRQTGLFP